MQTRRYPRTLNEAFGPYTSNVIHEPVSRVKWVYVALYVCVVLIVAAIILGSSKRVFRPTEKQNFNPYFFEETILDAEDKDAGNPDEIVLFSYYGTDGHVTQDDNPSRWTVKADLGRRGKHEA